MEPVTGIEPALSAWEADVLPLNYTGAGTRRPAEKDSRRARGIPNFPGGRGGRRQALGVVGPRCIGSRPVPNSTDRRTTPPKPVAARAVRSPSASKLAKPALIQILNVTVRHSPSASSRSPAIRSGTLERVRYPIFPKLPTRNAEPVHVLIAGTTCCTEKLGDAVSKAEPCGVTAPTRRTTHRPSCTLRQHATARGNQQANCSHSPEGATPPIVIRPKYKGGQHIRDPRRD